MGYREGLVKEDSWDVFEDALEEAVEGYVRSLADHLAEEYEKYSVDMKGVDSRKEIIEILGLNDYSIELEASDMGMRAYNIHLPEAEEPLLIDVERSVDESSISADEHRETVAYHFIPRSDDEVKFRNVRSEFQRITRPDGVDGNVSLFYRSGDEESLNQVNSWDFFDEKDLMQRAVRRYEDEYPGAADFDVELMTDSGKDWRIYEFDFDDIEDPMHLEISLRENGFAMNWKQDVNDLRYRNFVQFGFAEALDELTD